MADFSPSVEHARAQGIRVIRQEFPAGVAGVKLSLEQIALRIREGANDVDVQGWAFDQLRAAGIDGRSLNDTARAKMAVLLSAVRAATVYTPDPPNSETIKSAAAMLCLRQGLCIRGGDCFPQGTLLLRDDHTFVPIEEIEIGDRIWGRNKWSTVKHVWFKGDLKVDAVEMNNGSTMHLTTDHKVYVGRCKHGRAICPTCAPSCCGETFERVHVSDLQEGERLLQPDRIAFGEREMDPRRAYIEGLELADGWTEENRFCIAGRDGKRKEDQKHEVVKLCAELGIATSWHPRYVRVLDAEWATSLAKLGDRAWCKRARTIGLREEPARELLRGLMADSTANTHGSGRTYSTTSRTLMVQVRVLQRMFGRSTSVRMLTPEQHGGAGKHVLWRLGVRDGSSKAEKALTVKSIERAVREVPCWDIATDDHYVYLPEHDVTVSNCDDMVVLLGSVLMSVGVPVVVVKQTFGAADQEHVLIHAKDDVTGNWVALDPSTNLPAGQSARASAEYVVDPLNFNTVGLQGAPEFIGIGALPRGYYVVGTRHFVGRLPARRVGQASDVLQVPEATIVGTAPPSLPSALLWAAGVGAVVGLVWIAAGK